MMVYCVSSRKRTRAKMRLNRWLHGPPASVTRCRIIGVMLHLRPVAFHNEVPLVLLVPCCGDALKRLHESFYAIHIGNYDCAGTFLIKSLVSCWQL